MLLRLESKRMSTISRCGERAGEMEVKVGVEVEVEMKMPLPQRLLLLAISRITPTDRRRKPR
jgi:hypothetical protein